jgi:hypothetical protein
MQYMRADFAQTKAARRRNLRDTFPHPLNQIALRHVDSIATLGDTQRVILCNAILKSDLRSAGAFIDILNRSAVSIQNEDDLLEQFSLLSQMEECQPDDDADTNEDISEDTSYLAALLLKCYPDMPATSADALARADVMKTAMRVIQGTRNAVETANSDFVVVTLYTLFEEKRNELKDLINGNPAFIKAIQLSRPDWKSGH